MKITRTKRDAVSYDLEVDGIVWSAVRSRRGRYDEYTLTGPRVDDYNKAYGLVNRPLRTLNDVNLRIEYIMAFIIQERIDKMYPGLVEAFSTAHENSDIDGYGDEGAGYDHYQAIEEFMQSDAMKEYIQKIKRETATIAAARGYEACQRGDQRYRVLDKEKARYS